MKDTLEQLADEGVKRIKYYYKNTKLIGNICTVCLLIGENDELLSRGVAICSLKDAHRKLTGKNIALGRAIKALIKKETSEIINSERESMFGWSYIKNINKKDKFYDQILAEAEFDKFETKTVQINDDTTITRVILPMDLPLFITQELYTHKSSYKPEPTDEEKYIIGKRKLEKNN